MISVLFKVLMGQIAPTKLCFTKIAMPPDDLILFLAPFTEKILLYPDISRFEVSFWCVSVRHTISESCIVDKKILSLSLLSKGLLFVP